MLRPVACFARLMKLCRRRGRSHEDAEDLIQEALLRLEEYCRNAEVRNKEAFLFRTVSNLAINQSLHERVLTYAYEPIEELEQSLPLVDPNPGPDRIFAAKQHLEEIRAALDAVSPRTREIYFSHKADYRYDEIAAAFGISAKTVEKHVARAVLLLMNNREPL
jgi:RNA polymerase sigma factor (sigma-70 family)